MLRSAIAPLTLLAGLAAQQANTTAYIQDSLRGPFGNAVPFGCSTTGLFVEGRSQILISPHLLPRPNTLLTGIAVHSQTSSATSGTLTYPLLKITVSRASVSSLSPTFASNLPAPVVVLNATNLPIRWVANAWTTVAFSIPYVHDGQSALVIDIQKIVTPTLDLGSRTVQNAGRADLPRMINALGGAGSGAHAAVTATVIDNYALSLQLRWSAGTQKQVPTLKLRSDNGTNFGGQFAIGGTIEHLIQAAPGSIVVDLAAPAVHLRTALHPLLVGRLWLSNSFTLGQGTVPASGLRTTTIPIPNLPALVGAYIAFQSVAAETPAAPWPLTNAADCIING